MQVWACLRTLDSFGIQHAHVVSDPSTYSKKARLKTMCTAMGSQKWLTLHGHDSPEDAVAKLKADGYQVSSSFEANTHPALPASFACPYSTGNISHWLRRSSVAGQQNTRASIPKKTTLLDISSVYSSHIAAPPQIRAVCCFRIVRSGRTPLPFPAQHRLILCFGSCWRANVLFMNVCWRDFLLQVVASDLSPSAVPIGEIDWSVPTAVVLGNEERGISDSMRNMADATFVIPMRGFVRSFNMSVACSIILAHLSAVRYGRGSMRYNFLPFATFPVYNLFTCRSGVFWVVGCLGHVKPGRRRRCRLVPVFRHVGLGPGGAMYIIGSIDLVLLAAMAFPGMFMFAHMPLRVCLPVICCLSLHFLRDSLGPTADRCSFLWQNQKSYFDIFSRSSAKVTNYWLWRVDEHRILLQYTARSRCVFITTPSCTYDGYFCCFVLVLRCRPLAHDGNIHSARITPAIIRLRQPLHTPRSA